MLNHIISLILHQKETKHPPSLRQVPEVEKLVQGEGVTEPALSAEAQAEISQALSANRLETVHPPTDKGTYNLGGMRRVPSLFASPCYIVSETTHAHPRVCVLAHVCTSSSYFIHTIMFTEVH